MYTLAVRRDFIARHYLIGGDWGEENNPNSHHYILELRLFGHTLNKHGYLCDIVDVEEQLSAVVGHYSEKLLNDLPEFARLNPSIEHFARILAEDLDKRISATEVDSLEVVLWEHETAWAGYQLERK